MEGARPMKGSQPPADARVALVVAHPDDETLWAGGTLLQHPGWDTLRGGPLPEERPRPGPEVRPRSPAASRGRLDG